MFRNWFSKQYRRYSSKQWLLIIVMLSFAACVIYSFAYRIHPVVDAKAYDAIAQNIVAGNGFVEDASVPILFDRSIQRAGPAYEYFLAGIYALFGRHFEVVWIVQAALHALSALFLFFIAKRVFDKEKGEQIGLVAALLFGLHPDLIEISAMLMTETFYLFVTIACIYLFLRVFESDMSFVWSAALGAGIAIGILSRPPLLLFIPIIAVLYLIRRRFVRLFLMLGIIAIVMAPWAARNYRVYDQFILTTVIGEYNIWIGNTLMADGGQLGGGFNPFDAYVAEHGYGTVRTAARESFRAFLIEHPGRFIELTAIRFVRYLSLIRPMGFWFYQSGVPQFIFISFSGVSIAILFFLGFIGMSALLAQKKPLYYYLIAFALTSPLVLLPTVVQSRYRFQIYPFLALFAGYALVGVLKGKNWWKKPAVYVPVFGLLLVSAIDILLNASVILDRLGRFL